MTQLTVFGHCLLLDLDQVRADDVFGPLDIDGGLPSKTNDVYQHISLQPSVLVGLPLRIESVFELGHLLGLESDDGSLDAPGVLLELHAESLGLEDRLELVVDIGLAQGFLDNELLLGLVGVDGQVVGGSIGAADTFNPSVRRLDLKVPAVLCKRAEAELAVLRLPLVNRPLTEA